MKKAKLADSICNSVISLRFFICSLGFSTNFFSCASKYVKILVYVARNAGGRSENQEGLQRNRRYLDKKMLLVQPEFVREQLQCPPGSRFPPVLARQRLKKGFSFTK